MTLDSQVSNRQIRCTSARGRNDLKAQPKHSRTEQQHQPNRDAQRALRQRRPGLQRQLAQHEPDGDIDAAHQRQQARPPGTRDQTRPGNRTVPAIPNRSAAPAVIVSASDGSTVIYGCRLTRRTRGQRAIRAREDRERAGLLDDAALEPRLNVRRTRRSGQPRQRRGGARTGDHRSWKAAIWPVPRSRSRNTRRLILMSGQGMPVGRNQPAQLIDDIANVMLRSIIWIVMSSCRGSCSSPCCNNRVHLFHVGLLFIMLLLMVTSRYRRRHAELLPCHRGC